MLPQQKHANTTSQDQAAVSQKAPSKRGRKKHHESLDPTSMEARRERNRIAAAKRRAKVKGELARLEKALSVSELKNVTLLTSIASLTEELTALKEKDREQALLIAQYTQMTAAYQAQTDNLEEQLEIVSQTLDPDCLTELRLKPA